MRRRPAPLALLLAALLLLQLVVLLAAAAAAADEDKVDLEELQRERKAREALYAPRARVSRYLAAAFEEVDEGRHEKAMELLEKIDSPRLNPFERALVYRLMAFVAYSAGDYDAAIAHFERVLELEILPIRDEGRIRFNVAQIYAAQQKWPETITAVKRWLRYEPDPNPLGYYLLGIAHFQLGEYDDAITWTEQAIDRSPQPPEGWLQLLAALYIQKEDYASATPVLEELVVRFPKKQYWVQLSLIYGALENYRHSLAVQQVAYAQGLLDQGEELMRLARSYLYHDLPYPAAQVLENGLREGTIEPDADAYELLANSWIAAREYEKSLAPLEKAAQRSDDGNLYVRLGQVLLQREQWKEAADRLQKGIQKGSLRDAGNAELLLGIAYYNDDRVAQARSSFARARQHDSSREAADSWIAHIEHESQSG
jgi:tetratricopeptide (TPR) repeat protein